MRVRTARGGAVAKSPKISLGPGPIKQYMTQEGSVGKKTIEKQQGACGRQKRKKKKLKIEHQR